MRKVLFGALAVFAVFALLRRFAPNAGRRVLEKCREMMGGPSEERSLKEEGQQLASPIAR